MSNKFDVEIEEIEKTETNDLDYSHLTLKFSGKSFCNSYGGQGEITDHKINVKNVFSTKMFRKEAKMRGKSALWAKFGEGDEMMFDFFKFYLYIPNGEDELVMIR